MRKIFLVFIIFCMMGLLCVQKIYTEDMENDSLIYPEFSQMISMDFKNADISDVLKILSKQSNLNFIASKEIAKIRVTLFLENVPVEEALERILNANDLTYEIAPGSDIFIVKPLEKLDKELRTRIYRLKYASVSSSKINSTITIDGGSSSSSKGGIVAAVKSVISKDGTLVEDPRTNSMIITDSPLQFPIIEQTITRLDVPIPQILIEVEMLDVAKNSTDELGIKYGATPLNMYGPQREHLYPFNQNNVLSSEAKDFTFDSQFTAGVMDLSGLAASIQFLKSKTDTKSLARPRILTLNNETAEIKISTDEAIGLNSTTDSSEGVATQSLEAERVETGVFLTVTPQVNMLTGEITMAISPKVIEARTGASFEGKSFKDPEERGSNSILKVKDGETIVIGGLLRSSVSDVKTGLPWLQNWPILRMFFSHRNKSEEERELLIFITPHIIEDDTYGSQRIKTDATIIREQNIPPARLQEIKKALTVAEEMNI